MTEIPLADMITGLHVQLQEAQERAKNENLRFGVEIVELEATVGVTKDATAKGGVRFWVFEAGASVDLSKVATQRIKLSLTVPPGVQVNAFGGDEDA
jgi:hypothetical protein